MKTLFHETLIDSLNNVFTLMMKIEPKFGQWQEKADDKTLGDITGVITVGGNGVQGSLAVSLSQSLILELTKRMLFVQTDRIDETATDLAGEITNMVIGGAKSLVDDRGFRTDMSVPSMISGMRKSLQHHINAPITYIPVETEIGPLWIETCFQE
ncbi:MAG: chemotaxis protein CheX [Gammaproteobacteria bacterium]|nr:chemotaxis protein CheX [Gammaproteobacteria bacterium]